MGVTRDILGFYGKGAPLVDRHRVSDQLRREIIRRPTFGRYVSLMLLSYSNPRRLVPPRLCLCWPVAVVVVRRELIDKFIHKVLVLAADKPQRVHVSAHCLLASYLTIRTNELLTASTIKKCSVA